MSKVEVDKVIPQSGTTLTIGDSGDTINLVGTLQSNGSPLPGDISSVVAGTGLSGGGTTGAVTINIDSAQPTITSLGTITSFTSTGIDDNANATAITISSSNNVGIGNAGNALRRLDITQTSGLQAGVRVITDGSGAYYQMFGGVAQTKIGSSHNTQDIEFHNGSGEQMRIDSWNTTK